MKTKLDELRADRRAIIEIASRHKAFNVAVFGSVARGNENSKSDIDFLVDFELGASLIDQAALRIDLCELLETEIDLISRKALRVSDTNILQDAIYI
jgi:uncharacterized protein